MKLILHDNLFCDRQEYQSPEVTVFTEFLGANSFAGMHQPDEQKELVLLDVESDRGMVSPEVFIKDFADLKIARIVYRGKLTGKFIEDVRRGKYNVDEGVVCKGVDRTTQEIWMVKIKTNAYKEKLKQAFAENWESYWE